MRLTSYVSTAFVAHLQPIRYWHFESNLIMQVVFFHVKVRQVSFPSSHVTFPCQCQLTGTNTLPASTSARKAWKWRLREGQEVMFSFNPSSARNFLHLTRDFLSLITQTMAEFLNPKLYQADNELVFRIQVSFCKCWNNIKSSLCNMPASFGGS